MTSLLHNVENPASLRARGNENGAKFDFENNEYSISDDHLNEVIVLFKRIAFHTLT